MNPFQTRAHCERTARRIANVTGDVLHVLATGRDLQRFLVVRDFDVATHPDLGPEHIVTTIDPFETTGTHG